MDKQYRYDEIKEYFKNAIENAEKTDNKLLMRITLFSILDSMAQEYGNYNNKNLEMFERFICKFSSISYLKKYEPITTYYELKNKNEDIQCNLDYLEDAYNYCAEQIIELEESEKILNEAKEKGIDLEKHTYGRLIYKYRSKLVHEYILLGVSFKSMEEEKNINYISCGFEPNIKWELNIPYTFLKTFTIECINNYIEYCQKKDRDPYANATGYNYWYE